MRFAIYRVTRNRFAVPHSVCESNHVAASGSFPLSSQQVSILRAQRGFDARRAVSACDHATTKKLGNRG